MLKLENQKNPNYAACVVFKLKNFGFLERETKSLDAGEVDIETAEAGESA